MVWGANVSVGSEDRRNGLWVLANACAFGSSNSAAAALCFGRPDGATSESLATCLFIPDAPRGSCAYSPLSCMVQVTSCSERAMLIDRMRRGSSTCTCLAMSIAIGSCERHVRLRPSRRRSHVMHRAPWLPSEAPGQHAASKAKATPPSKIVLLQALWRADGAHKAETGQSGRQVKGLHPSKTASGVEGKVPSRWTRRRMPRKAEMATITPGAQTTARSTNAMRSSPEPRTQRADERRNGALRSGIAS